MDYISYSTNSLLFINGFMYLSQKGRLIALRTSIQSNIYQVSETLNRSVCHVFKTKLSQK